MPDKKIFLSYGHDANAPLVERLRKDLEAAGYAVWMDTTGIEHGADWRRSITEGLLDTDWVLGFLSKHSVRDPGVCLDELGIALHHKHGAVATVLLEGDADPPVSVSHIQWLDMHDWAAREAAGGADWETWYAQKRDAILAMLANPDVQRFAGEIAELEVLLDPVGQQQEIAAKVEGFVGREWLAAQLEDWRRTKRDSRLLWIAGAAGTGKSAFAAWLGHKAKVNVIGINLCAYNVTDRRDAGRVIRTLAFQVASRLADVRHLLLGSLKRRKPDLSVMSATALFHLLLVEPLGRAIDGGRRSDRVLIVIDGLDETVKDGHSELAEVLAAEAAKLPAWVALVATSRPDEPIKRQFAGLNTLTLDAAAAENVADLRRYIADWLGAGDPRAARIEQASEGNFLYVRMLREAATEGSLTLDGAGDLPKGLGALYGRWFRHRFPDTATYTALTPLIEVLVAAEHPVPEDWLGRIFGWSKREMVARLERLGSLFERRADGVAPFHKSLRDWLRDPDASGPFSVEAADGTRRLATALWSRFVAEPTTMPDAFTLAELPAQVGRMARPEVAHLVGAGWADIRLPLLTGVLPNLRKRYAWTSALAWTLIAATLAESVSAEADRAFAFAEGGDILKILGQTAGALKNYRDGLAIAERLAASDRDNADWQRDLSISYDRVGDVLAAGGDRAGALKSYRDGLAITERLAASDRDNSDWQRDLSISYNKVGDMLAAQGDRAGALRSYRDGLAIAERLAASDRDNAGWQRDLSSFYDRVGGMLVAGGDRAGALRSYRDGLAIAERLAASDRDNADWQRDLSISYSKVGDVLVAGGDRAGALRSYRDGLAIAERLSASDRDNSDWQRDLSVWYERVGNVLVAQGDRAGALRSYRDGLAIAERLAASDRDNAGWQRDLSISYTKVGDMLVAQGDRAGALRSYRDGLTIRERLAASDRDNADWQRDLIVSCVKIADLDAGTALAMLQRAQTIATRLSGEERLAEADAWMPAELARRLNATAFPSKKDVQTVSSRSPPNASRDALSVAAMLGFVNARRRPSQSFAAPPSASLSEESDAFRAPPERYSEDRYAYSKSGAGCFFWLVAAVVGLATAFAYWQRTKVGSTLEWLSDTIRHSAVAPPAFAAAETQTVADVSVYAPPHVAPRSCFLVQVFVHDTDHDEIQIASWAIASDAEAQRRAIATLDVEISFRDRLDITLEGASCEIEEPRQSLIWRGKPRSCTFAVTAPDTNLQCRFRVRVFRQSLPIGQIGFAVGVSSERVAVSLQPVGESSTRYRRAFLSYATSDRVEVIKRAQALKAARIDFFQDLISLEPGENWKQRLFEEIERCDIFILFWSKAASLSEWVSLEIDHALACHRNGKRTPEILPILIEGPPPAQPPDILADLHFNDPLLYVIAASERLHELGPAS